MLYKELSVSDAIPEARLRKAAKSGSLQLRLISLVLVRLYTFIPRAMLRSRRPRKELKVFVSLSRRKRLNDLW